MKIDLPASLNAAADIERTPWDSPDGQGSATVALYWGSTIIQQWTGLDFETFFGGNDEQRDDAVEEFVAGHLRTMLNVAG